jgi:hypothetical protein
VDLSLDNPATTNRKALNHVRLFDQSDQDEELLMDVDESGQYWDCVARALFTAT